MSYLVMRPAEPPWGDYGSILIDGMSSRGRNDDGLVLLERAGPYIPPITFPGIHTVVVTDQLRSLLLTSGLTGLAFAPVVKSHVVRIDWQSWSRESDEPLWYPESGEPEGYLLGAPHDESAAIALGDLWELAPVRHGSLIQLNETTREVRAEGVLPDFFSPDHPAYRPVYVSVAAQDWLQRELGEWVDFRSPAIPLVGA